MNFNEVEIREAVRGIIATLKRIETKLTPDTEPEKMSMGDRVSMLVDDLNKKQSIEFIIIKDLIKAYNDAVKNDDAGCRVKWRQDIVRDAEDYLSGKSDLQKSYEKFSKGIPGVKYNSEKILKTRHYSEQKEEENPAPNREFRISRPLEPGLYEYWFDKHQICVKQRDEPPSHTDQWVIIGGDSRLSILCGTYANDIYLNVIL